MCMSSLSLQDWESMVSLLLDDKCGIVLTDEEEGALIEVMTCAVRRAVGTGTPPARMRGKVGQGWARLITGLVLSHLLR